MKRKDRTAEKAAADPKRFSGDGSAPPRLSVWFSALFLLPFRRRRLAALPRDTAAGCGAVRIRLRQTTPPIEASALRAFTTFFDKIPKVSKKFLQIRY